MTALSSRELEIPIARGSGKTPPPPKFKTRMEYVAPERAAEILAKHNGANRTLSEQTAEAYARDMVGDRWLDIPVFLMFSKDGNLLDGQHRLKAIEKSGVGRWCLICYDLPDDIVTVIDLGRRRTVADQRRLLFGETGAKRRTAIATVLGYLALDDFHAKFTVGEINAICAENTEAMEWAMSKRSPSRFTAAVWGALCFAWPIMRENADKFADALVASSGALAAAANRAIVRSTNDHAGRLDIAYTLIGAAVRFERGDEASLVKANPVAVGAIRKKRRAAGLDGWTTAMRANGKAV